MVSLLLWGNFLIIKFPEVGPGGHSEFLDHLGPVRHFLLPKLLYDIYNLNLGVKVWDCGLSFLINA